jgi:DDE superfamily endonuclease
MIPRIPTEMKTSFKELKFSHFLRQANITKAKGFSAFGIFITIFLLTFQHETWFQQKTMSKKSESLPGKDAVYRFLNKETFNWRKFLLLLSSHAISKCEHLTAEQRVKVLIVDDSLFERARSKKVELLSKVFDHTSMKFVKGYQLLTLGWSDGATFIPVNFGLIAYTKYLIEGISDKIDKRTSGYKRRKECLSSKPKVTTALIIQALKAGISADYVLMDTWFTEEPLIKDIREHGLEIIGTVKRTTKRKYHYKGKEYTINQLIKFCNHNKNTNAILGSLIVRMKGKTQVKIVFVRHRSNPQKWLAVLSTDVNLSDEEIIRIYGYRWEIIPISG